MNREKLKSKFLSSPQATIREVISKIDSNEKGIVLVVNEQGQLIGTVTDGDIRRAVLVGEMLEAPIEKLLLKKKDTIYPIPITASTKTPKHDLLKLMQQHKVRHIPILDEEKRIIDLVIFEDFQPYAGLPLQAVIMAGGYGHRLHSLTEKTPKPLLLIGQDPILKLIIQQLREAGITRISVSTHYQAEKITEHFGDGKDLGVSLQYLTEDSPLGTAGSLALLKDFKEPLLVINGDILTKVSFRAMLEFHQEHKAELTMGVQTYDVQMSYGIVETQGGYVERLTEKQKFTYLVNAGIYLIEPSVQSLIPKKQRFDMTDLIQKLLAANRPVASFPIREYWLDIGSPGDYEQAQGDIQNGRYRI